MRNTNLSGARQTSRSRVHTAAGLAAAMALAAGCASPLRDQPERDLRRYVRESTERELTEARNWPVPRTLTREPRVPALDIEPRIMQELVGMAGPESYVERTPRMDSLLLPRELPTATIGLHRAIATAVENNLNVQFARLAPSISRAQVAAAEAAFDWVLFGNSQWSSTDQPRTSPSIGGSTVGVGSDQRQVVDATIGVRKPLVSGGQFTVQHQFTYTDVETDNLFNRPDPAREANIVVQLDQPLLRGFGSDVTLAQVRLAQNAERDEVQSLKSDLIRNVVETETAYWTLVRARNDVLVLQRLLERGEEVLGKLRARKEFDARPAQIADASANVESRRAQLMQAQKVLRDAGERLKLLMNDPDLPVGAETLLLPADDPVDQPVELSLTDSINSAIAQRPEVQRAIISLDNTAIRLGAADNARLPLLNLRALTRMSGMGDSGDSAYDALEEGRFVDYQVAVAAEVPLGNRAAESNYTVRRLERQQAAIAYRNTLQNIVSEVKAAIRDVELNYILIEQNRAFRIAAAENLRALQVEEETLARLTPEFLDLKLRRQQALAAAEQQEWTAMTDYNASLARLHGTMGTVLERNRIRFDAPSTMPDARPSDLFPDYPRK
ncbi:MAG: TolC family protein [Phycisphaeraceae bacterium]|nr:TolC family protein [Phycisphaeraceae bacterium]MBX3407746.1 TolC family protein [Phycisphaeraceae bacterium]